MSTWVGYAISVNCGEPLGCYQGTIVEADGNTITLTKAFRNGFPYPKSQVTLNAADIKDLKIIEVRSEPIEQTHSTVPVAKTLKKGQKATVCENLQANPSSTGNQQIVGSTCGHHNKGSAARGTNTAPARSKPIDIMGAKPNKNSNHAGSYGTSGSTPKARPATGHEKARRRNEACFGDEAEPAMHTDFDFEGNLALFDKRALFERMRHAKPDLVRHADDNFRPDESVLGAPRAAGGAAGPPAARLPPEWRGASDYATDGGLLVPAAAPRLRARLWAGLRRAALLEPALALMARAAADVALRLAGGGRRLDPRNAHQAPVAVALAGPHALGAAGLLAARLLAAHGVRAAALALPRPPHSAACPVLERELAAAAAAGVALEARAAALPAPDVLLLALHDPTGESAAGEGETEAEAEALLWARGVRGAAVALEPPGAGWAGVAARASVLGLLPAALAPALGRVYLANVAPPAALFAELGLEYRPPFGAASALALHPADADADADD